MSTIVRVIGFILIIIGIFTLFYGGLLRSLDLAYVGLVIVLLGLVVNLIVFFRKPPTAVGQSQSINSPFG